VLQIIANKSLQFSHRQSPSRKEENPCDDSRSGSGFAVCSEPTYFVPRAPFVSIPMPKPKHSRTKPPPEGKKKKCKQTIPEIVVMVSRL
jgi:hypothetical protein